MNRLPLHFALLQILAICSLSAADIEIVYPPDSGVFNVVTDGGVDNTGTTDVTAKLQQILDDRHRKIQVVYFPKGTYLVSGQLRMKLDTSRNDKSHSHGPWLVGESRAETIIRLKDGTWTQPLYDFTPGHTKPEKKIYEQTVLSTGDSTNTTFNKIIRNMTVNIGRNNAGAVGVMYNTSNSGYMGEVNIISEDGAGAAGLALAGVENGPGQIRSILIKGFEVGIYNVTDYVTATSDILIDGATKLGIYNHGQTAADDITIKMAGNGPAIQVPKSGVLSVIGAKITGSGNTAIENEGMVYLRDVETSGYKNAITGATGTSLAEYHPGTAVGLFYEPKTALKLPIKKQPLVPYEKDFSKWANPMDYGAIGDGKADDTEAVQKALSAPGKTHVVFPHGKKFTVKKPLTLGADVVRVVGTDGVIFSFREDNVTLTVGDGSSPVVVLEGLALPPTRVKTKRTVVMDSCRIGDRIPEGLSKEKRGDYMTMQLFFEGTGDVFLSNTHAPFEVDNPSQKLWSRHYNNERGRNAQVPYLEVKQGVVWMLGWKSENLAPRVRVQSGGVMEITGFNNWEVSSKKKKDGPWPAFEVNDGQFSLNMFVQRGSQFNNEIVWETRNGKKLVLTSQNNPNGKACPLYTGYDPKKAEALRK